MKFFPYIHCVWLVFLNSSVDGVKGQTTWLPSEKFTQLFICLFTGSAKGTWFGSESLLYGTQKDGKIEFMFNIHVMI